MKSRGKCDLQSVIDLRDHRTGELCRCIDFIGSDQIRKIIQVDLLDSPCDPCLTELLFEVPVVDRDVQRRQTERSIRSSDDDIYIAAALSAGSCRSFAFLFLATGCHTRYTYCRNKHHG